MIDMLSNTYLNQNPITLSYSDKALEKEFKNFIEYETKGLIRLGILFSILGWFVITCLVYFVIPEHFTHLAITISLITYPFFAFIVYSTFNDRFIGYYQLMAAIANSSVGLLAIYVVHYFPYSEFFMMILLLYMSFFAFYMLRLRLKYALVASLLYMATFQWYIVYVSNLEFTMKVSISVAIWYIQIASAFGGYISESTSRQVFIQQKTIAKERLRSESLLLNILPKSIAERLKKDPSIIADYYESTSILFADIVGFTKISEKLSPTDLVQLLNQIFSLFDNLIEKHGLEKIKTIGDAYMIAGGFPNPKKGHLHAMADLALQMQKSIRQFNSKYHYDIDIRIGIHTGPAVAGVIGNKKMAYDVWGDTVNTASRMESHGITGKIQVSERVYSELKNTYRFDKRESINVKGKGMMNTYILEGLKLES
jgi:class 3 adenylate cyclase